MEIPILVDDENMPLATHHDQNRDGDHDTDYDNYSAPNTTAEEKVFTTTTVIFIIF